MVKNKSTGQTYIGATNNPDRRWYKHCYNSSNKYLRADMKIHGKSGFVFDIIESNLSFEEAKDAEDFWLSLLVGQGMYKYNILPAGQLCKPNVSMPNMLSLEQRKEIKNRFIFGHEKAKDLAIEYGILQKRIWAIARNKY